MSKRSFEGDEEAAKRTRFEINHGQKRQRDEEMGEEPAKRVFTERDHMMFKMEQLRTENERLRTLMGEKDRTIQYGVGQLRQLNAELFSTKQQLQMMEAYISNMEGRSVPFYVS